MSEQQPSIEQVRALDGRIFAMLDADEERVLNFYRDRGRKYGVSVSIINEGDPGELLRASSKQQSDQILKRTNSRVHVRVEAASAVVRKIFRFDVDAISSPKGIRFRLLGMLLRLALLAGHPVVLIGACRTGKSLLMNNLTSNIIDKQSEAISTGRSAIPLDVADIPLGIFGIDECQNIAPHSLEIIALAMAERRRAFVLCCQRFGDIERTINAYRHHKNSKSLVVVVMGRDPQYRLAPPGFRT